MNKKFYKNPGAIAAFILFIGFFILPFFTIMGFSATGFKVFKELKGQSFLLILIPLASAYIIYAAYAGEKKFVVIAKWALLILSFWFIIHIGLLAEKHSFNFVGFGLWLDFVTSILLLFEAKITALICKPKIDDNSTNL
ncbi:MAG: hypothetical protein WCH34_18230 [Bacteroidota bacterium]